MSRRYGRNQKRHHREEIAALQAALAVAKERLDVSRRRIAVLTDALRAQRQIVEDIAEAINAVVRFSALLPPQQVAVPDRGGSPLRFSVSEPQPVLVNRGPVEPRLDAEWVVSLDLWEVSAVLEDNRSMFEQIVHVILPHPERGFTYRISETAWRAFKSSVLPEVARQIYLQIATAIRREHSQ